MTSPIAFMSPSHPITLRNSSARHPNLFPPTSPVLVKPLRARPFQPHPRAPLVGLADAKASPVALPGRNCVTCGDERVILCTPCNGVGFLEINTADAMWGTCEVCRGRGKVLCLDCQPPDAPLPDDFAPKD